MSYAETYNEYEEDFSEFNSPYNADEVDYDKWDICEICQLDCVEAIKYRTDKESIDIEEVNFFGNIEHSAAVYGAIGILRFLKDRYVMSWTEENKDGQTALDLCRQQCEEDTREECIEFLMKVSKSGTRNVN
jgi:hypothetical protein